MPTIIRTLVFLLIFGGIGLLILLGMFIRQINQYERGLLFTMGRYTKTYGAGWKIRLRPQ